jgi:hypothetical protein
MILLNPNVTQIYLKFLSGESETRKKLSRAKAPSVSKIEERLPLWRLGAITLSNPAYYFA